MGMMKSFLAATLGFLALSSASAQNAGPSLVPQKRISVQAPDGAAAVAVSRAQGSAAPQLTSADVAAWLDGFMPFAIGKGGIPGAVVVVVKDGQVVAERGYGFADTSRKVKVDPDRTLFRPGSISKLFIWTALMQQVQLNKVDLNADVNRYLDFKIPPLDGKPITLTDLLTHTAGFEEQIQDVMTTRQAENVSFEQLLKRWVPRRVFAPGTTPAYSNYGSTLAAYVVQRVSGEPFEVYVERHIFAPLGMTRSTFRQPLPPHLRPLVSAGYVYGKVEPHGFEFVGPAPAGSLSSTGRDMARFMIAHLHGGGPILAPATTKRMHSRLRQRIAGLNGMTHGFYETSINGQRVIAHGGDTIVFHSDLRLFLDQGTGIFISMNSSGKDGAAGSIRRALFENFADRYFPAPPATRPIPVAQARANAAKLAGLWSVGRRSHSNFLSIGDLFSQMSVGVGENGKLLTPALRDISGAPRQWVAVGPMLWREVDGHEMLGARVENGEAVLLGVGSNAAAITFTRVPFSQSSAWLLPLLILSLAVLLITALLWPIRAAVRRRFAASLPLEGARLKAYRASRIASFAIVALVIAWAVLLTTMLGDVSRLSAASDAPLHVLQVLSAVIFTGGAAAMAWYVVTVWKGGARWPAKIWSVLLLIAALAILYVSIIHHLIGWAGHY
jgi:CubicO group peptidase (beta-lactamase class C family)